MQYTLTTSISFLIKVYLDIIVMKSMENDYFRQPEIFVSVTLLLWKNPMLQCCCQINTTHIVIIAFTNSTSGYRKYRSFKYKKIEYHHNRSLYFCKIFIADVHHVGKLNTVVSSVLRSPGKNTTSGNAVCSIYYIL